MDFSNLTYLKTGNIRQRKAYQILDELRLFRILANYQPLLAGTIPIEIDVASSDLDICCEVYEPQKFVAAVSPAYGHLPEFHVWPVLNHNLLATVIRFRYHKWPVELYGQPLPAEQQAAYRHMLIEYRILSLANQHFREKIIELKQTGLKTEPAFSRLLNLPGDPYEAVLKLENYSAEQLQHLLNMCGYRQ